MASTTESSSRTIGTVAAAPAGNVRLRDSLTGQLGEVLSNALKDLTSLEVRTLTLAPNAGDEGTGQLRARTRIGIDGDTDQSIPLLSSGEPDEALWRLHTEAVAQARKDRAATLESVMALVHELSKR